MSMQLKSLLLSIKGEFRDNISMLAWLGYLYIMVWDFNYTELVSCVMGVHKIQETNAAQILNAG